MKFRTIIFAVIGLTVLVYLWQNPEVLPTDIAPPVTDSLSIVEQKVDFEFETMQEKFISEAEFWEKEALKIPMAKGDVVATSVLGGSKITTCVVGFIVKRPDSSLYTLFVHLPGDKTATWDDKNFEYHYRRHNLPIEFVYE